MTEDEKAAFYFEPQKWNRFTYVMNNPLKYSDPTGLEVYDETVDEEARQWIHESLVQISKTGTKAQRAVAKFILENDVVFSLETGSDSGGKTGTVGGDAAAANAAIDRGWMSVGEAAGFVQITLTWGGTRPNSAEGIARLEGTLVHEGEHAFSWARTISSLSANQGMNRVVNPTFYDSEFIAFRQEALYYQVRGGVHQQRGLDRRLLQEDRGRIGISEKAIREKLVDSPYRVTKDQPGPVRTQLSGLRPPR